MSGSRRRGSGSYRTSSRRRGGRYNESGGSGGTFLVMIGLILIATYLLMDEQALGKVQAFAGQVVQTFQQDDAATEVPTVPVANTPSTQAQIVKILAYTLADEATIEALPEGTNWYSKHYGVLQQDGRFPFLIEANAQQPITYAETLDILKIIAGEGFQVSTQGASNMQQAIALKDFVGAYQQALDYGAVQHGLVYEEVSILGTQSTNSMLAPWQVATDKGIYGFEGLIVDPYKDYTIQVLAKGDELLGIISTVAAQSTVEQCYIQAVAGGMATVQIDSLNFQYQAPTLTTEDEGKIGKIIIQNNAIIDFQLQLDEATDTIVKLDEDTIEFAKAGTLPYDEVLVYNGMEKGTYNSTSQLFSGVQVTYTVDDGKVDSVKVVNDTLDDTIRVLISEDGLGDYSHSEVTVISESNYTITTDTGEIIQVAANTPWIVSEFSWEKSVNKLTVEAADEKGIYMQSMTRQGVHPLYEGKLEIYKEDKAYQVVNVLPIETYVAAVIPSEMPTSYGLEAVKVQAVAARSYAMSKRQTSQYLGYGAQVDDTVATQVYNRVPADAISKQAVEETKGEVLTYNDQIISGNFFATSCGYTADFGETWANGEIFPTNTPIYLVSRQQYLGNRLVEDLTTEKDAYSFFTKAPEEVEAFDSASPWFRWQVDVTGDELSHMIHNNVYRLTTQYPNMVKVKDANNQWVIGEVETIGDVKGIEVTKRGSGGNIMEMIITGTQETLKVSTEYLVRSLLAPRQMDAAKGAIQIVRADGSTVDNMAMLPSAFFSMDMTHDANDVIESLTIYGGGFGHGVGMSQDGVKGMANMGYTYKEILRHYYAETDIKHL